MLETLNPYFEYEESRKPCFGQIPKHWKVLRNGQIFAQRNQTGFPDLPILEVSLKTGVRVRDFENLKRKQVLNNREKYKRVGKGDIAYNMMRMWQGAVGVAPVDGLVSPAYVVATPLLGVDSRYYSYLFRTHTYMNEINKYSHGIVADRNRLYWDEFKQIPSLFPPSNEQKKIADFLDNHGRRTSLLLRKKRRQVELLKELKQTIINSAVTRGINSEVQLKSSGIELLGDIPSHWEIRPLKYYVKSNIETISDNYPKESEIEYIDISTVGFGELKRTPVKLKFKDAPSRARRVVHYGDTIISTVRTYLRSMCFVDKSIENCIVSTGFAVLTPNNMVYPQLLNYVLASYYFINYVSKNSIGVSYPSISESKLISFKIALPSTIEEQQQILDYISEQTKGIDNSILVAEKEIQLITEYRTRLITDVVTGKIDVRDILIDDVRDEDLVHDDCLEEDEEAEEIEECEV